MLFFVLTFTVLVLALAVVAARRRHFLLPKDAEIQFGEQLPVKAASLFAPDANALAEIENDKRRREQAQERERTLAWASLIDFAALPEIKKIADEKLRQDAFEILTERARTDEDVCALVEFVLNTNQVSANKSLTNVFQQIWKRRADRVLTARMFRLAAASNDAELFLEVLNQSEQFIASGKLTDLSTIELQNLAISHYWLLGESARTSGAGFMLKQKLAVLRW